MSEIKVVPCPQHRKQFTVAIDGVVVGHPKTDILCWLTEAEALEKAAALRDGHQESGCCEVKCETPVETRPPLATLQCNARAETLAAPPRPLANSARYGSEPAFQTGDKFVDIVLPLYNEWVKTDGKEGFKDANEACVLFAAWVLFQRQPAAPAAIEQARPQPPRCPTCNSAIRPAGMSFCQDNFHAAAAEPAPERTPPQMKWQCEVCGRRYAEYVNGCPACWERNIRARVVSVVTANKKWSELYGKLSLKRRAAIEARVAGEVARIEKKPYDVNPFPGGSELFKEWQTGYYDADEAILARAVAVPEPADKQDKKPLDSRWENAADLKKETK